MSADPILPRTPDEIESAERRKRVRRILFLLAANVLVLVIVLVVLVNAPRPPDTTAPEVFAGDGRELDYCTPAELDGKGLRAGDIPRAYTPQSCSYEVFPMPVLAECTEPLSVGATDLRGLWQATSGMEGHVERIEQCGSRVVITSAGIIHDMVVDGTLAGGANDVRGGGSCLRIFAAADWVDGTLELRPFGGPLALVRRSLEGDELVWHYPGAGVTRMKRICRHP